jgi:hypothetical protein
MEIPISNILTIFRDEREDVKTDEYYTRNFIIYVVCLQIYVCLHSGQNFGLGM